MAKLKYEFFNEYYKTHRRRLRDYLFGYIGQLAALGHYFAPLANPVLRSPVFRRLSEPLLGLARQRPFPALARRSLRQQARNNGAAPGLSAAAPAGPPPERVFFLSDPFSEYFQPQAGLTAIRLLAAAGCQVEILPVIGSGRTLISKGFLEPARRQALRLVETIARLDPAGTIPVVGVEPSEIASLRDEYLDLLPGDERVIALSQRAFMIDEFMIRPGKAGQSRIQALLGPDGYAGRAAGDPERVLLHGHCYQKAQPPAPDGYPTGVPATVNLLEAVGFHVNLVNSGCCGMAGAFGYEKEHYEISQKVGEQALLPAVRAAGEGEWIAAAGVSCQAQIEDGSGRAARHPIVLVGRRLLSYK